jgi:nucleoside-diphosphate-sugar epimerase
MVISRYGKQESFSSVYDGLRVVVIGAAGFIGRWVARVLSLQGAEVFLIDQDRFRTEEISSVYAISGEIVEVNNDDHDAIRKLFKKIKPSITFNLAGYGVIRSERDDKTAYSINVDLVKLVVESISAVKDPAWPGQDIVHVGTAMEYGDIDGNLSEDSTPNPTTLYGKSKLAGTIALAESCRANNVKGLTARLFMIYGPGEQSSRLLPSLIKIAKTGEYLKLTTGKQERDFTYIDDVAEGLMRLGLCKTKPGEIVNLATGKLASVRYFAETAAQILHIEPNRLEFGAVPTRTEEMRHSEVSTERLKQLIGWIPTTNIERGILKTKLFVESHRL